MREVFHRARWSHAEWIHACTSCLHLTALDGIDGITTNASLLLKIWKTIENASQTVQ